MQIWNRKKHECENRNRIFFFANDDNNNNMCLADKKSSMTGGWDSLAADTQTEG